jgi:4-hydroxybenzoate polyprenyltransferase
VPEILPSVLAYAALTAAYSLWLKRVPLVELMAFGGFYLLRVVAGGEAAHAPLSPWLTLTVLFAALFMISAKRHAERAAGRARETLAAYPEKFLDGLVLVSATMTLVTYGLYTILGAHRPSAVWTAPVAFFGAMRYLQLLYAGADAEFPERLVLADRMLLGAGAAWIALMTFIFYA